MRESIDPILTERPTPTEPAPVAHRFDEFPAGYPWAGCSPAEPASVSPTKFRMPHNGNVGDDSSANGNPSPSQLPQGWGSLHHLSPSHARIPPTPNGDCPWSRPFLWISLEFDLPTCWPEFLPIRAQGGRTVAQDPLDVVP